MMVPDFGYVYFITYDNAEWRSVLPFVKIGFTYNISRRLTALSTGSPVGLIVCGYIESSSPERVEIELHRDLDILNLRANGEWFKVNARSMDVFDCWADKIKENRIKEMFDTPIIGSDMPSIRAFVESYKNRMSDLEKSTQIMRDRLIEIDPLAHKYIPTKSIRPYGMKNSKRLKPQNGW